MRRAAALILAALIVAVFGIAVPYKTYEYLKVGHPAAPAMTDGKL